MSRLYGQNAVEDLLKAQPSAIARVLVVEGSSRMEPFLDQCRARGVRVHFVHADELRRRSGGRGAVSVGADLRIASGCELTDLERQAAENPFVIALDGITDPHNLGAIMRSAAAFGASAVLTTSRRSAPLNDAAVRASAGAVAHVPLVRVTNLARALRSLKKAGYWVVASLAEGGVPMSKLDLKGAIVLIVGAEGTGVREKVAELSDFALTVHLPGPIQSLNASVFAGIAAAEVARQRLESAQ